jgi:hypothetical protein
MNPLAIATDGYLSGVLAIATNGYLSSAPAYDDMVNCIFST